MRDEARELLVLAAKASRIGLWWDYVEGQHECSTDGGADWNPWDDDGDSGRLGAHLRICVLWQQDWVQAYIGDIYVRECYQGDRAKALRHAYVRVAAEVGKNIHN